MEAVNILKQRSEETYNEAIGLLDSKGICALVRPMGFGKTYLMCRIARRPKYRKCLYVYPTKVIRESAEKLIPEDKVTFITYSKLGRLRGTAQELAEAILKKFDLIIFDEIHHLGARHVQETVEVILNHVKGKIDIIGGTATPRRMDGFDAIDKFFDNSLVSFYGLNNMIEDKLMEKPTYFFSSSYTKEVGDTIKLLRNTPVKDLKAAGEQLSKEWNSLKDIINASEIIKKAMESVYGQKLPSYMRFMVFFSTKELLKTKSEMVEGWFKQAFPEYTVEPSIQIMSTTEGRKGLDKLKELKHSQKTIHLVCSINMLNEGYHFDGITGVVLLRSTKSPTIYPQQIGRSFQIGMKHSPLILDFVSNIEIQSLYGVAAAKDGNGTMQSIEDQLDRINDISPENIYIYDNVATLKKILQKINNYLSPSGEAAVIKMLKQNMPLADIARKSGLLVHEILQIMAKQNSEVSQ